MRLARPRTKLRRRWPGTRIGMLATCVLAGCASYHRLPLPGTPDLAATPSFTVPVGRFELPGLSPRPFDPRADLDQVTVMALAVVNDPGLKAARRQAGIAEAQAFEAGLLPDPRLEAGLSHSSYFNGYDVGLTEDLKALATRGAARASAEARRRQVDLGLLWQEEQVAERARELFTRVVTDRRIEAAWLPVRQALDRAVAAEEEGLRRGEVGAVAASGTLAALTDAEDQLRQAELDANASQHSLCALLGLAPATTLRLAATPHYPPLSLARFAAALSALPRTRADLLALRQGYESQEQRVREAVLAQFPAIDAGVERSRDAEEHVLENAFTIGVTLPLFNRNRGQIAVQRATRAALRQEYQARLDEAAGEADELRQSSAIMFQHLREAEAGLSPAAEALAAAGRICRRGELSEAAYMALASAYASRKTAALRLEADYADAEGALRLVLGLPLH